MTELIVVGFEGIQRATQVLDQLQALNKLDLVDLKDAVTVYRTANGRLHMDQSLFPTTTEEATGSGVLGALVGITLAAPFAVMALPAAATALVLGGAAIGGIGGAVVGHEDAATFKDTMGISDATVREVAGMVQPGQSAVFVLARVADPDIVVEQFRGYGGRILRTTLTPTQGRKLQATLADDFDVTTT